MNLVDVLCSPWAILEDRYAQLRELYAAHLAGKLNLADVEARMGRELRSEQQAYTVRPDGVAMLSVDGIMANKANIFMRTSGMLSTQMLAQQLDSMAEDRNARAAIVVWDSPGGNALGVPAAAAAMRRLAAAKPTVSVVDGVMASAAYWVGSAANAVYIEGETNVVGSIGVVQRLSWDPAEPNSMVLARGKYKVLSANGEPPSAEVLAQANGQLDYLYSVFVDTVAQHRGVSADAVLERMADGRVFIGQQALDAGLVDGYSTVADMADRLAAEPQAFASRRKARTSVPKATAPAQPPQGAKTMDPNATQAPAAPAALTREAFQAQHAALYATLQAEFTAAGAAAERQRIQDVRAALLPGHEALIERMASDGKTTGAEAAMAIVQAERADRTAAAAALGDAAPKPAAPAATPAVAAAPAAPAEDKSLPIEQRAQAAWDGSAAIRAEFGDFKTYVAYAKANESGKVRVLGGQRRAA